MGSHVSKSYEPSKRNVKMLQIRKKNKKPGCKKNSKKSASV
jgi:hypothetical protein